MQICESLILIYRIVFESFYQQHFLRCFFVTYYLYLVVFIDSHIQVRRIRAWIVLVDVDISKGLDIRYTILPLTHKIDSTNSYIEDSFVIIMTVIICKLTYTNFITATSIYFNYNYLNLLICNISNIRTIFVLWINVNTKVLCKNLARAHKMPFVSFLSARRPCNKLAYTDVCGNSWQSVKERIHFMDCFSYAK